ncbi:MAG TPA: hypothetical protein VD978_34300 [Azospirillum sp.]|nr:hypothetical protein [Azospirillum sp.]
MGAVPGKRATVQTDGRATWVFLPDEDPSVAQTVQRVVERIPELIEVRRKELAERDIEALVNVYLADSPVADAERAIAADNARMRAQFLTTVPCLSSADVHRNSGSTAGNASITASRWKSAGRIFSVPHAGKDLFPAFQFRDGQPHPTVAKVLAVLPTDMSPWQVAFWFVSGNGWLDGMAPADALDREDAVVAAARREGESTIG